MDDWLEEYGGTIAVIAIIIFFGWLFLSGSSHTSSNTDSTSDYNSSSQDASDSEEDNTEPLEFHGYDCTDDCSGHEAGYDWADEKDICSEYESGDEYSGSYSNSFNKGVTAYIEENC